MPDRFWEFVHMALLVVLIGAVLYYGSAIVVLLNKESPMTRDRLDFLGALLWYLARALAVLFVSIRLITYIDGLERRGQASHEAFLAQHERMMRDHDQSIREHQTLLQRLPR